MNGLRIAYRTAQLPPERKDLSSDLGKLSVGGSDAKLRANLDEYSPSPSRSRDQSTPTIQAKAPSRTRGGSQPSVAIATDPSSYSPSPPFTSPYLQQQDDNVVRVKEVPLLASPPPPSAPPPSAPPPSVSPVPAAVLETTKEPSTSSGQFPVSFTSDAHSPSTSSGQFPVSFTDASSDAHSEGTTYPPPPASTASNAPYPQANIGGGAPTMYHPGAPYPPGGGRGNISGPPSTYSQPNPYQPVPQYPQAYGANLTSSAFNRAGFQQAAPSSYDANIGFSFGGGGGSMPSQSAQPTLYNPYHHQNPSSSTAPHYPPGAPNQGSFPAAQPPGKQGQNMPYGFNF